MAQNRLLDGSYADNHLAELTANQRRTLDLIASGKTNAQIGDALGITLDGAKWNVSEILTKLGFASREEVAAYWRSRQRARALKQIRGWISIPAVGWAAAGIALVAAVTMGIAVSSGGSDAPSTSSVAPFYIEAVVTQYVEPDDSAVGTVEGVGTGRSIRSREIVRWWHQDRDHARFEFERTDPPLSASSFTLIFDGTRLVSYSSTDNSYEIQQQPPASSTAGGFFWPGKTILFGPSIEPSIPALLDRLSHWNEGPVAPGSLAALAPPPGVSYGPAVKVGETQLLGRRVVVLERSPAPNEQTVKFWVDPESMLILRHESNDGRWVAEITRIDPEPRFDESLFVFTPPPGARDRQTPPLAASPLRGRDTPTGFYEPRSLPLGFLPGVVRSEANSDGVVFHRAEFHRENDPSTVLLTFEQRRNVSSLPATLAAGERLKVGGHDAYLSQAGQESRLLWSDGRLWLMLATTWLSRDQLLEFAGSLQPVP